MSISDPQLLFYLERKVLIDRWASLRSLESTALDEHLTSVGPSIEQLAVDLGASSHSHRTKSSGVLGLHRPEWQIRGERPIAVVAIAWSPTTSSFTDQYETPWVGVRVEHSGAYGEIATRLAEALHQQAALAGLSSSDGPTANWPAYRWVAKPDEISWQDLGRYRELLLSMLQETWTTTASIVDGNLDRAQLDAMRTATGGSE